MTATIMGVLNVTPDSFSDGNKYYHLESAVQHAQNMIADGADIIDIGGESSRPGATPVSLEEETKRTLPLITQLRQLHPTIQLSLDTVKPQLMAQAVDAGVDILNDISGFNNPESINIAAESEKAICVMHMQGKPQTMQKNPQYTNVTHEVCQFFIHQYHRLTQAGIAPKNIIYDPGFGFGKTLTHNQQLFGDLTKIKNLTEQLQGKLLIGVSRKTMIGDITNIKDPQQRIIGSVAAALLAQQRGVDIIRVHDVQPTKQALTIAATL